MRYGHTFFKGEMIRLRPSQALSFYNNTPWSSRYFIFEVLAVSTSEACSDILANSQELQVLPITNQFGSDPDKLFVHSSWFDWSLEGLPEFDFFANSKETMSVTRCVWCHALLTRRVGGEFNGHWQHVTAQNESNLQNFWVCNFKTVDGKSHLATHLKDYKPVPKPMPHNPYIEDFVNGPCNLIFNESNNTTNRTSYDEVLVLPQGRKFKF